MWRTTCPGFDRKESAPLGNGQLMGQGFNSLGYNEWYEEGDVFTGTEVLGMHFFRSKKDFEDKIIRYLNDMKLIVTNLEIQLYYRTKAVKKMQLFNAFVLHRKYTEFIESTSARKWADGCKAVYGFQFEDLYRRFDTLSTKMTNELGLKKRFEDTNVNIVTQYMDLYDGNNTMLEYYHDLEQISGEEYQTKLMNAPPNRTDHMQYKPPNEYEMHRSKRMMMAMLHRRLLDYPTSKGGNINIKSLRTGTTNRPSDETLFEYRKSGGGK
jgi:hypothetical protein